MFTPNPNRRPSGSPQKDDDWVAVLVALGVIGGAVGWILAGGDFLWGGETLNSALTSATNSATTETSPSQPGLDQPNTISRNDMPDPPGVADANMPSNENATQSAAVPSVTSAGKAPANAPTQSQPPSSNGSLTVPTPRIPDSENNMALPVIRAPLTFADVPEGYWAKPYIDALTARGVLNGLPNGTYAPKRPMTRAEFAAQIANAFDIESQTISKTFKDVPEGYWAADTIDEAVTTGFMTGYPENTFQPKKTVPRLEVLTALATGLSLPQATTPSALLQSYSDQAAIPAWAREQVASTVAVDIIRPSSTANDTALRPREPATRAEVAVLIYNALAYMGQVEPIP
ncbi:S-layer homology domain-containing protein [Oscillatoria sp. CS-180]|uniref:S-layer homology domain-containing protein n=1 Tax=Oscillatoria sp. CS-180 TaxID=3021720 RepID=UPI00232BD2BD|nr:S-layer homology domain-containing protein [Oscillatoria sp. CS-180]MDB9528871.1 S-layer homology domain-containing protein [Oscillatoria sp. CS-180]